jgi:hypothetical protein
VKIKTEAEEDRDQLEHQVSVSSLSFDFQWNLWITTSQSH